MSRTLAEPLFHHLLRAFPASRAYPPAFFEQEPMPAPVVQFLRHDLNDRVERDLAHLSAAPEGWFDDQHADVQQAHASLQKAVHRHARIPEADWAEALRRAVRAVVDVLVRPAPALTDFVFEAHDEPRSALTILHRLDYFSAYPYLRQAARSYLEERSVHEMDRERFEGLLRHVDRQMTQDHTPEQWMELLRPLYELARAVPKLDGGLPPDVLATFFAEKGADEAERRIRARTEERSDPLTAEALRTLLAEPVPEAPAPPSPSEPSAEAPRTPAGPVPLWQQFQHGGGPRPAPVRPRQPRPQPQRPPQPPPTPPSDSDESVPLWQRFQQGSGSRPAPSRSAPGASSAASSEEPPAVSASLEELERKVLGGRGPKNRKLFIKHLFGGSVGEYEHVLRRLSAAASWQQASQLIAQDVFRKQQVNIYSEPAVAFTEAVEARFRA